METATTPAPHAIGPAEINWARALARRAARRWPGMADDFEGGALLALAGAAARFDPARCDNFRAYAARRIVWAITDEMRRARRWRRNGEAPPAPPESGELPVGWEIESEDAVRHLLAFAREAEPVRRYYLEARHGTLADAARACGISASRARMLSSTLVREIRARVTRNTEGNR